MGMPERQRTSHEAEQAGWDGFFVWEPVWGVDAWVSLTAAAMRTEKITRDHFILISYCLAMPLYPRGKPKKPFNFPNVFTASFLFTSDKVLNGVKGCSLEGYQLEVEGNLATISGRCYSVEQLKEIIDQFSSVLPSFLSDECGYLSINRVYGTVGESQYRWPMKIDR